jgi:hypothetical protein
MNGQFTKKKNWDFDSPKYCLLVRYYNLTMHVLVFMSLLRCYEYY